MHQQPRRPRLLRQGELLLDDAGLGLDRVAELLDEATALKQQADEALAGGKGLGEYQRLIDESNAKVAEAQQLLEDTPGTAGTPGTTTTSASVPPT